MVVQEPQELRKLDFAAPVLVQEFEHLSNLILTDRNLRDSQDVADRMPEPELKGSIGEGPNHSNHSNRSNHSNSFKIQEFSLENSKISTFSKLSAKIRQIFIKI